MKKLNRKSLSLSRETVRTIGARSLDGVAGGYTADGQFTCGSACKPTNGPSCTGCGTGSGGSSGHVVC